MLELLITVIIISTVLLSPYIFLTPKDKGKDL
jgi:hypothetical protein